jgi:hypothetical protein
MSALFGLIAWLKLCCDAAHQVTTDNLTLTDEQLKEKYPLKAASNVMVMHPSGYFSLSCSSVRTHRLVEAVL